MKILFLISLLLGAAVAEARVCVGDTVWTESGLQGEVIAVFPGRSGVSVRINYSNYNYDESQLAVRGCYYNLCSGAAVITGSGLNGKINGVYPSGSLSVEINYSNYVYSYYDLASTDSNAYGNLPTGETVWTKSGLEGRIAGIFPSGEYVVTINYSNYKYTRNDLATRGRLGQLSSGDRVVTRNGLEGKVQGFFSDNGVLVEINYSNYVYSYYDLARTR